MAKLTLADLANLTNEVSVVGTINNNSNLIEAALEDTLSRSGTAPNTMNSQLDMNSNRIINLPAPVNPNDAARKIDVATTKGDAATVAVGSVMTVPYGAPASVVNVGTQGAAIFNFSIPAGANADALFYSVPPQGRLTLTAGVPDMQTSVASATTVYYTPYAGNLVPISNGTNMVLNTFTELSQATTDTTKSPAAVAASSIYDMFVWMDNGVIRCTRGPAWTNASTRSLTLTYQYGVAVNTSAITNGPPALRGTWVGTIASNSFGTIDFIYGGQGSLGIAGVFNVWNAYNQIDVGCLVADISSSYTYSPFTIRQAHASTAMQVSFVCGAQTNALDASYQNVVSTANVAGAFVRLGVGYDSTAAFSSLNYFQGQNQTGSPFSRFIVRPNPGTHTVYALESSDSANANTFNTVALDGLSFRYRM